jgi:hypothetical protein
MHNKVVAHRWRMVIGAALLCNLITVIYDVTYCNQTEQCCVRMHAYLHIADTLTD